VGDFTERGLIDRIQRRLPKAPPWLLVGIGDDGAVVEPERNRVEVLSVDALVEGVHFDRAFVAPEAIGHRALAVNLSDLAAMGAAPRLALLSLALPGGLPIHDFDGIVEGLTGLAVRHRLHVAGGNLTRSPGPLMIDITVIGTVKRRQALTRSGARPGDDIYVSGTLGGAAAGLRMLSAMGRSGDGGSESVIQRYLYPEARVRLGLMLARNRAASAAIDLSDGLSDGAHRIAECSGVGMVIDADALPIEPDVRRWFADLGLDPVSEILAAGDDYELLFTTRPRSAGRLRPARQHGDAALTKIGICTEEPGLTLRSGGIERELRRAGYDHFR
jgi:thiamine-monophosphate kinase